jgi:Protein of unknown function (DUF1583)
VTAHSEAETPEAAMTQQTAKVRTENKKWPLLFLIGGSSFLLVLFSDAFAQEPATEEIYQDFRNSRPLLPSFRLWGPELDAVVSPEPAGLRITLPATRTVNKPVQIAATFTIVGDFEITGSYDLLAADMPAKGYGVGVSLNIADDNALNKFAKVSRLMRPQTGSRFMAEYWVKDPPKDYQARGKPTETRSGQLRLAREGAKLMFLASEGPGKEFIKIYEQDKFGTEDLKHLRFQVTDGNSPGLAVDARLVDLRVRMGKVKLDRAAEPAPLAAPAPPDPVLPAEPERKTDSKGWLAAALILGLAFPLLLAGVLGGWLYLRRRRGSAKMTAAPDGDLRARGRKR